MKTPKIMQHAQKNVRVFNMMKLDSAWKKVFIKNCTMMNATGAQIRASLMNATGAQIRASLMNATGAQIRASLKSSSES